jgi:bacteriocin-like protein
MSRHVREATGRELTENELSQVAGGWSVDTLAAMGEAQKKGQSQGSGVSEGLSLSYGSVTFSYR